MFLIKFLKRVTSLGKHGENISSRASCAVKPGSSIYPNKTAKFIKDTTYTIRQKTRECISRFEIGRKIKELLALSFDIGGTGAAIWYCVEHHNFISYGIISALVVYYFKLAVKEIRPVGKK